MKIAIITPGLPYKGGAARYTWELSEYLSEMGDEVTLFSLFYNKKWFSEKKNIKINELYNEKLSAQSIKFWLNLQTIKNKIKQGIEELNPDIILFMNFPSTLWAQKFGDIPVLCYPQDISLLYTNTYIKNLSFPKYISWLFFRKIIRVLDKKRWKVFNEVICNSEFSEKNITSKYDVKSRVIYVGTRTDFFKSVAKKKNVILTFAAQKAQRSHVLLNSIADLLKNRQDFEIWVVGNQGDYGNELQKLVDSLEISKYVKFFGRISDDELVKIYSQALVTIHLVRQPPFGMIVTESMSCETPVIACHPGGTDETIIHNKTGFLIAEEDEKKIIEYIEKFLTKPELSYEMGKIGREEIIKNFDQKTNNEKFRKLMLKYINQN